MRPHVHIPDGLLPMWGVFPSYRFRVSITTSQKNRFQHFENGKGTFRGTKRKSASVVFLAIPRVTRVSDMASFRQTMPWSWTNLAHFTQKSRNLERDRSFLWRNFLVNIFSQGLNFFTHLGDIKWLHAKVSYFFDFFELVTPDSRPASHDNAGKLPLAPRRCGVSP
jgi:hypothetical protein